MENIDRYLSATDQHLGIEAMAYYPIGYGAMVADRGSVKFLFELLYCHGPDAIETGQFLQTHPLFSAAFGATAAETLDNLDRKLGLLYTFTYHERRWQAMPRFSLQAPADVAPWDAPGEDPGANPVSWDDIVNDIRREQQAFVLGALEANCSTTFCRDLHALVTFHYDGEFAVLKQDQ